MPNPAKTTWSDGWGVWEEGMQFHFGAKRIICSGSGNVDWGAGVFAPSDQAKGHLKKVLGEDIELLNSHKSGEITFDLSYFWDTCWLVKLWMIISHFNRKFRFETNSQALKKFTNNVNKAAEASSVLLN